jgi:hypothetical protein
MPCKGQSAAAGTPLPCQQLAAAQNQLLLMMSGQQVQEVETPQLGRVVYRQSASAIGDLQRLIDSLQRQCNQALGIRCGGRRPISVEAWP